MVAWITEHHVLVGMMILYGWLLLLFWFAGRRHRTNYERRPYRPSTHVEVIDPNEEPFNVEDVRGDRLR